MEGKCRAVTPISVLIATADRARLLEGVLRDLLAQTVLVEEIVVVDASSDRETERLCTRYGGKFGGRLRYLQAAQRGAAVQRNQGIEAATQAHILFMDDDIEFGPDCVEKLWCGFEKNHGGVWGGVNAMIVNQRYQPPGRVSRWLFRLVSGQDLPSYAGRCLGPAVNLLPEDDPSLPEYVEVEWLNTTCTLYRREALPSPVFSEQFTGYSLGEDLDLSLIVGRRWKLANARTARIVHHTGQGPGKPGDVELAKMALVNRHYIMTRTMGRRSAADYAKLALVEIFFLATSLRSLEAWRRLLAVLRGKVQGVVAIALRS